MAGGKSIDFFDTRMHDPKPLKFYLNVATRWAPSVMTFGVFGGAMFLYFTDWKVFMNKVPFYRKKFEEKEPIV